MDLNYVRFDVGHYLYCCHRTTIEKFQHSVLAKYISPEFDKRKSGLEYIVVDRDGKHFGTILNFMRDPSSLNLDDWSENDITDLMREADFYCLIELMELCDKELELRRANKDQEHSKNMTCGAEIVPSNGKMEVVFGYSNLKTILESTQKRTFVISYRSMRFFHIDSWIEELVTKICDHNKFNVYCLADRGDKVLSSSNGISITSKDFIIALYEPPKIDFSLLLMAPTYDKFRARRDKYKYKLVKFWCSIQQNCQA